MDKPLSVDELKAFPTGTLIKPHSESHCEDNWYAVALKVAVDMWSVTGHGNTVRSADLIRFADAWEKLRVRITP